MSLEPQLRTKYPRRVRASRHADRLDASPASSDPVIAVTHALIQGPCCAHCLASAAGWSLPVVDAVTARLLLTRLLTLATEQCPRCQETVAIYRFAGSGSGAKLV